MLLVLLLLRCQIDLKRGARQAAIRSAISIDHCAQGSLTEIFAGCIQTCDSIKVIIYVHLYRSDGMCYVSKPLYLQLISSRSRVMSPGRFWY